MDAPVFPDKVQGVGEAKRTTDNHAVFDGVARKPAKAFNERLQIWEGYDWLAYISLVSS